MIGSSRGSETILGETSDSKELFLVDECDDNPLGSIVQKCVVSLSEYILWSYLVLSIHFVHKRNTLILLVAFLANMQLYPCPPFSIMRWSFALRLQHLTAQHLLRFQQKGAIEY